MPFTSLSFVLFFFFGIFCLAQFIASCHKRTLRPEEKAIIVFCSVFVFYPFLLFFFVVTSGYSVAYPLILLPALILILQYTFKKTLSAERFFTDWNLTKYLSKELCVLALLYGAIIIWFILILSGLPDSDPYSWMKQTSRLNLDEPTMLGFSDYRPLFVFLGALFSYHETLSTYAVYKYVFPALWILWFIPFLLIQKNLQPFWKKATLLFLPFASSAFFLTNISSLPQSLFHLAFLTSIALIWHSKKTKELYWASLALAVTLIAAFYFEFSAVITGILIVSLSFSFLRRKNQVSASWINQPFNLVFFLVFLAILFRTSFLYEFFLFWFNKLHTYFQHIQINFLFPYSYTNIDGNSVGWGSLLGVAEYYTFYAGLLALILLLATKKHFLNHDAFDKVLVFFLSGCTVVFFLIAEVLPRLMNIALLPERALPLLSTCLIFLCLIFTQDRLSKKIQFLLLFVFFIQIAGAGFIHFQKNYTANKNELPAIQFLKSTLPERSIIYTPNDRYFLSYFLDQNSCALGGVTLESYADFLKFFQDQRELQNHSWGPSNCIFLNGNYQVYIYYAEPLAKNPYRNRPYMLERFNNYPEHLYFNDLPNIFEKVYSDEENHIYIWRYQS